MARGTYLRLKSSRGSRGERASERAQAEPRLGLRGAFISVKTHAIVQKASRRLPPQECQPSCSKMHGGDAR